MTFADSLLTEAMEESENVTGLFSWAYSGVNFDLAGNGGIECRDFISVKQRVIETVISCAAAGLILYRAITHLTLPKKLGPPTRSRRKTNPLSGSLSDIWHRAGLQVRY